MTELDKMARKIFDLEIAVANLRTRERPSYASGFISDLLQYPQLRGLWTFGPIDDGENIIDMSGQDRTMFAINSPTIGVISDRQPYSILNGSTQYYHRAGISITGAITIGGWFYMDAIPAADSTPQSMINKYYATTNQRAYRVHYEPATGIQNFVFTVSSAGTSGVYAAHTGTVSATTWYNVVGRFVPSTSVDIYVNGVKVSNTTSVPASIYDSTAFFCIGAEQGVTGSPVNFFDGRVSLSYVFAAALDDNQISYIYNKSRPMFGA